MMRDSVGGKSPFDESRIFRTFFKNNFLSSGPAVYRWRHLSADRTSLLARSYAFGPCSVGFSITRVLRSSIIIRSFLRSNLLKKSSENLTLLICLKNCFFLRGCVIILHYNWMFECDV